VLGLRILVNRFVPLFHLRTPHKLNAREIALIDFQKQTKVSDKDCLANMFGMLRDALPGIRDLSLAHRAQPPIAFIFHVCFALLKTTCPATSQR
jgi:hypothetical protein